MANKPTTAWDQVARTQTEKAHKADVSALHSTIAKYVATVADLEKQLGIALSLGSATPTAVPVEVSMSEKAEAVAVALASDWHAEETVKSASTNGLNEYNLDIARDRIDKFFAKTARLTEIERNGAKIDDLVLWLGGDLMTGMIHEELAETNAMTPTEVILWLQERILCGLETLKPHFRRIIIPTSYGNHGRCHDAETELLTKGGWKKWQELHKGDLVATFNVDTGTQEWQPLLDVYVNENYSGDMFYVKNNSVDFVVTPNHRMLLESNCKPGVRKFMEMQELDKNTCGHWFLPKQARNSLPDFEEVTDDELRLVGWLWTDGSIGVQRGLTAYRIHQSKPDTCTEIAELLTRMGLDYGAHVRQRPVGKISGVQCLSRRPDSTFAISAKHRDRLEYLLPKKPDLPDWFWSLSERQVKVFLDTVKRGDGTEGKNPDGHFEIYGRSGCLDSLQALLLVNGVSSRKRIDTRGHGVLSVRSSSGTVLQRGTWEETVQLKPYKGVVWCGTAENGTLITRRNGIPLISGNSTKLPRHGTGAQHSYEWLLYKVLEGRTNSDAIVWQIADSYFNFLNIFDRRVRFHHGDGLKYQGGIGGLTIPTEKAVAAWNKSPNRADLDVFGHWHTYQQSRTWLCNGSLIGYNAYALSIKASFEPPTQTYFLIDKKRGRTMTAPILL